jgi:MFS family permease
MNRKSGNLNNLSKLQGPTRVYGRSFWAAYLSNTALMIAVSLMFRYSDFVEAIGGNTADLGWITGLGTAGAICVRLIQGDAIDRLGARTVWVLSMSLYVVSLVLHTQIRTVAGVEVYLVCFLMYASLAGAFGSSLTFVSLQAPPHRVTEVIGMLGSSGFVGMAVGPMIGDLIYSREGAMAPTDSLFSWTVHQLMWTAAAFAVVSLGTAVIATWGKVGRPQHVSRRPPSYRLVRRYQPGFLLVVAAGMGIGIGLFHVFVRPFAEHIGVDHLRVFFLTYSFVAFTVRLSTRTLPARLGEDGMIFVGYAAMSLAMLSFVLVDSEWGLVLPALIAGTAHAFLFPAVVASGCYAFPARYRGLATTLVLAMFDTGNLIGRPILGQSVALFESWGWDGYRVMFVGVAALLASIATCYAFSKGLIRLGRRPTQVQTHR